MMKTDDCQSGQRRRTTDAMWDNNLRKRQQVRREDFKRCFRKKGDILHHVTIEGGMLGVGW